MFVMLSLFIPQCWYEGTNRTTEVRKNLKQYLLLTNCVMHFLYNMGSFENEGGGLATRFKEVVN